MTKFPRYEAIKAGADLSAEKGKIVKLNASGEAVLAGLGEAGVGVIHTGGGLGSMIEVFMFGGDADLMVSAALAVGTEFASDANGKARAATVGNKVLGIIRQASTADGDIVRADLVAPVLAKV